MRSAAAATVSCTITASTGSVICAGRTAGPRPCRPTFSPRGVPIPGNAGTPYTAGWSPRSKSQTGRASCCHAGSPASSIHTMVSRVGCSRGPTPPSSSGIHAPPASTRASASKRVTPGPPSAATSTHAPEPSAPQRATGALRTICAPARAASASALRMVASGRTKPPCRSVTSSQSSGTLNCGWRRRRSRPSIASTSRSWSRALRIMPAATALPGAPPATSPVSNRSRSPASRARRSKPS